MHVSWCVVLYQGWTAQRKVKVRPFGTGFGFDKSFAARARSRIMEAVSAAKEAPQGRSLARRDLQTLVRVPVLLLFLG